LGVTANLATGLSSPAHSNIQESETLNGVLDSKPYSDEKNRSFIFRTVGYRQHLDFWADFVSTLQMVGYDALGADG
jgi:hypothetical protein